MLLTSVMLPQLLFLYFSFEALLFVKYTPNLITAIWDLRNTTMLVSIVDRTELDFRNGTTKNGKGLG